MKTTPTLSSITLIVTWLSWIAKICSSIAGVTTGAISPGVLSFTHNGIKYLDPYCSLKCANSFAAPVSTAFVIVGVNSDMII